jgi:hypothetical protein
MSPPGRLRKPCGGVGEFTDGRAHSMFSSGAESAIPLIDPAGFGSTRRHWQDPDGNEHVISSPLTKKPVVQKLPPVSRSAS